MNFGSTFAVKLVSIFLFCSVLPGKIFSQSQVFSLDENWTFSEKGKNQWKPAVVPGNIHRDLLLNKMIPDPTEGENYKSCAWVEKKEWEYRNSFSLPALDHFQNTELVFEGMDTNADVSLNDP